MSERPILFSGPMVCAILADAKTQTRRVVTPQPAFEQFYEWRGRTLYDGSGRRWFYRGHDLGDVCCNQPDFSQALAPFCPYGAPGDDLWVRETWAEHEPDDVQGTRTYYRADHADGEAQVRPGMFLRWTPSIHMPRDRSRITLRVTSVRVERLHAITEGDARAEGAPKAFTVGDGGDSSHRAGFRNLWRDINGAESWDANPWVWRVEFWRRDDGSAP